MKTSFPATIKTKKEKFDFLVKNQRDIVALKKADTKKTDAFGRTAFERKIVSEMYTKASPSQQAISDTFDTSIIGNTYLWMDSHDDVHIPGIFTKSLQENKGNIPHLHDHCYELEAKVGVFKNIYEQPIPWVSLGVNKEGNTVSLVGDTTIVKDLNANIFFQYSNKQINQHSVGMIYVNMFLCINDPAYKEYYVNWQKYSVGIGNIEKCIENGFFWAITEAKLKEISCVFKGSNELTGIAEDLFNCDDDLEDFQENEATDPQGNGNKGAGVSHSNKNEPPNGTRKRSINLNCI